MVQDLDNINYINLWPTTLCASTLAVDFDKFKKEIYKLAEAPSVSKSNYGGWQSHSDLHLNDVFKPLQDYVKNMCVKIFNRDASIEQMWANINKKHDHNLIHSHGNLFNMSGVFYINVDENSGDIVFRDPRPGAVHARDRLFIYGDSEHFKPFQGFLLLFPSYLEHFVLPSASDIDRISLSFDIILER
jgi:uncharacterized protein (TIGR02466 family)